MAEVFVIDRVITAPGCARKFLGAYLSGYAPGARKRGMSLCDVLVSPPIWLDDRPNVVTIKWSLPSPQAWWEMTRRGRPDPAVRRWWDSISDLVTERTRSVASADDDVASDDVPAALPATEEQPDTFGVTRLIDVAEAADREQLLSTLREAAARSGALRAVVQPTLSGSLNGGDILVHLRFANQNDWHRSDFDDALNNPAINHINGATYRGTPLRRGSGSIYRTLLLRVAAGTDPATIAAFEQELAAMPQHVSTIAAWQLSRVDHAVGTSAWTHVFEQEFTDVEGLMGPYLMHPIHWAVVDRWFDPETTDVIVRDRICHSFCRLGDPVL